MEENFLQAAQGLNFIEDYSIKRKPLDRAIFRQGTFHEFDFNGRYQNPSTWSAWGVAESVQIIPNSVVRVVADEYAEYQIIWSLELAAGESELIIVHPFANGQLIGHGSHAIEHPFPWDWGTAATGDVRKKLVLETAGSPPDLTIATAGTIEDPHLTAAAGLRARAENHQGRAIVTLDQGVFWFGLVFDGPKDSKESRQFPAEEVLFSKCLLSVNKVNR